MSQVDRFYSAAFSVGSGRFPGDIPALHLPDVVYISCGLRELNNKDCHRYANHRIPFLQTMRFKFHLRMN